jgi:hypothetical protein
LLNGNQNSAIRNQHSPKKSVSKSPPEPASLSPMPLAFRDFLPRQMAPARGSHGSQWEAVAAVVERANQWLAAAGFRVVSVETLLLPSAKFAPPHSGAGGLTERWDEDHTWVQVVRVWHETTATGAPAESPVSPSNTPGFPSSPAA